MSEWLDWRQGGIGASDVAGILGISPWASRYSVWHSKTMGGSSGHGNPEAMRWGVLLEDAICTETERRLGITIFDRQKKVELAEWPTARATLDGLYYAPDDEADHGVIEIKTTSQPKWSAVPEYYEAQIQWQLLVTGEPRAWLPCLHMGRKLSLWQIDRDIETGQAMLEIVQEFWARHVMGGEPPPIDSRAATTEALKARYPQPDEGVAIDLAGNEALLINAMQAREMLAEWADAKAQADNELMAIMGDAEIGEIDGRPVVTWRRYVSKRLDVDLIRDKYPREAAECTTETEGRRFLLKKGTFGGSE